MTEAEAIADLVDAETDAQRRQALRQMQGELGRLYEDWRSRLMRGLAYVEASIDFIDEDLPADVADRHMRDLEDLEQAIAHHLNDQHRGERLRDGIAVAILGAPNAGKSSLLNALARRDAAIVSSTAGTTRDVIDVHLDIGGYPVILADTAGLRDSTDAIENEGIRRALARAEQADIKILLFDGQHGITGDDATLALHDDRSLVVINKMDLSSPEQKPGMSALFISAKTGHGIDVLLAELTKLITKHFADTGSAPLTRARHRTALEECRNHLKRAFAAPDPELRAEDLRLAMRALGSIKGRVNVDDLLDIIFRDFCIGK